MRSDLRLQLVHLTSLTLLASELNLSITAQIELHKQSYGEKERGFIMFPAMPV